MTSVKEFRVETPPTDTELGDGAFLFTDAYSVFDWGAMPDSIPNKGASLCAMGAYNFELLESRGIPTHYQGVFTEATDRPVSIEMVDSPPAEMAIELTQVPELPYQSGTYNYDTYHQNAGENYLVPLEIVFRNTVPIGSSLRRRTEPSDHGLTYDKWPDHVVELDEPIIEFSTKYEESDRYLDVKTANEIAGFASIDEIETLAREVNECITQRATDQGFVHQDGKIEVLYHQGELKVADVVGTFDENRFQYEGQQLSKEVLREYHRQQQPAWVTAVKEAKQQAHDQNIDNWRTICTQSPSPLPESVLGAVEQMYTAGANAYTGQELFDAPSLTRTIERIRELVIDQEPK